MDQLIGFPVTFLANQGDISLNVNTCRASLGTGRNPFFGNHRAARLSSQLNGFKFRTGDGHRANLDTITTGSAAGKIDIAGTLLQDCLETFSAGCELAQGGIRPGFNIGVFQDF